MAGTVFAGVLVTGIKSDLPDTSSLTLDNLVGTDSAGYAGLEDDVGWHWDRIFAGAARAAALEQQRQADIYLLGQLEIRYGSLCGATYADLR